MAICGETGCEDDAAISPSVTPARKVVVVIRDHFFSPFAATIEMGDTLEWVNLGSSPHTVTSGSDCVDAALWPSQLLRPGSTQFIVAGPGGIDTTGVIQYYCEQHCINTFMRGSVIISR
jgi:plastocyanin